MVAEEKKETVKKPNMNEKKVFYLLHLARKARKLQLGFDACERSCGRHHSKLMIIAEDLSKNSRRRIVFLAKEFNIKVISFGTKESFGAAFKLKNIGIICVEDENFAKGLIPLLRQDKGE